MGQESIQNLCYSHLLISGEVISTTAKCQLFKDNKVLISERHDEITV